MLIFLDQVLMLPLGHGNQLIFIRRYLHSMPHHQEMINVHLSILIFIMYVNKFSSIIKIDEKFYKAKTNIFHLIFQSVGVGRYNLLFPIRDETIADKRKRPKRRNIGFLSTTSRFASTEGESILTYVQFSCFVVENIPMIMHMNLF